MKQQKLSTYGFILIEVTMGVILFSLLMLLILQGIGFMVQRIAYVAHRHSAICSAVLYAQQSDKESVEELYTPEYIHSSIVWHKVQARSGDHQTVTLYTARQRP